MPSHAGISDDNTVCSDDMVGIHSQLKRHYYRRNAIPPHMRKCVRGHSNAVGHWLKRDDANDKLGMLIASSTESPLSP